MAVPVSELQKINPSAIIELFVLELDSTIHGTQPQMTWRFHNGVSEDDGRSIVFGGVQYLRMPIEADGFAYESKQLPRPTLRISNILGTVTTILLTLPMGLEGAKVTRLRTLARYIDHANFPTDEILTEDSTVDLIVQEDGEVIEQEESLNPHGTPDSTALFPSEVFYIDRKSIENREIIEFELAASADLAGVRLPKRQVLPDDFPGVGTFYS